jgi:hypothetical protein
MTAVVSIWRLNADILGVEEGAAGGGSFTAGSESLRAGSRGPSVNMLMQVLAIVSQKRNQLVVEKGLLELVVLK